MGRFWRGINHSGCWHSFPYRPCPDQRLSNSQACDFQRGVHAGKPEDAINLPAAPHDADQVAIADSVLPHDELIDLTSWLGSLGRWRRVVTRVSRPRLRVLRNPLARVMFRNKALDYFGFAIGP